MAERLLAAFAIALAVSLAVTPLMRRLALSVGIVDRPAARKVHTREIPYLGGLAIAAGTLAGLLVVPDEPSRLGLLVIAAVLVGVVGLLDDDRTLGVTSRIGAQIAAAGLAVAAGVRARPTGIPAYDIAITIVWIVGITNAINLLDNIDGLAGGVSAAIAATAAVLAGFGGQEVVGTLTAAVAGACIGFLAFNWRPASIFMGDAGALFLGYVLSIAVLEIRPAIARPGSLVVPLLLCAIPLLDTTTVVLGRRRRGISVARAGKDHLSHRLVALGLTPATAVAVLVGVQLAVGTLAVFAGRGVLPWWIAGAAGASMLALLSVVSGRAQVYREPVCGLGRSVVVVPLAVIGVAVAAAAPAAYTVTDVRSDVFAARDHLEQGLDALRDGEVDAARSKFESAQTELSSARDALDGAALYPARAVPVVGPNLRATRAIVDAGVDIAASGAKLAVAADPQRFEVVAGRVPVEEVEAVAPELEAAAAVLRSAREEISGVDDAFLAPVLGDALRELEDRLTDAQADADRAALAARLVPGIFGADGPRRYFLAVQNSAELRATGGFIGNWGILEARDGRVELGRFERIETLNSGGTRRGRIVRVPSDFAQRYERFDFETTWQNVNMTPDFPTSARVIHQLLPQSGGPVVDGVIAIDPPGLAALLELTGPVMVEGWPVPITADNVVPVTLSEAYTVFDQSARIEFLGDVARAVWGEVTRSSLGSPVRVADALGTAVEEGHLMVWLARADETELVTALRLGNSVPAPRSDTLLVVSQNAAGNKADYYLSRSVRYEATIEPVDSMRGARVVGSVSVALRNDMPDTGLPRIVMGPYTSDFVAGENRSFVSVYTRATFSGARLDGQPVGMESATELGRHVASRFVSMPSRTRAVLDLDIDSTIPLDGGWYRLDLLRQPMLEPDDVDVVLRPAPGWRVADVRGPAETADDGSVRFSGELRAATSIRIRLDRPGAAGVWDRLRGFGG